MQDQDTGSPVHKKMKASAREASCKWLDETNASSSSIDLGNEQKIGIWYLLLPQEGKKAVADVAADLGLEWNRGGFSDPDAAYIMGLGYGKATGGDGVRYAVFDGPREKAVESVLNILRQHDKLPPSMASLMEQFPAGYPIRAGFDLEMYVPLAERGRETELMALVKDGIHAQLLSITGNKEACKRVAVCKASRRSGDQFKISHHIVFPDVYFENVSVLKLAAVHIASRLLKDQPTLCKSPSETDVSVIDTTIYGANKFIRMPWTTKFGGDEETRLVPISLFDDPEAHLFVPPPRAREGHVVLTEDAVRAALGIDASEPRTSAHMSSLRKDSDNVPYTHAKLWSELLCIEGARDPRAWKLRASEDRVEYFLENPCVVETTKLHQRQWNSRVIVNIGTWEITKRCCGDCMGGREIPVIVPDTKQLSQQVRGVLGEIALTYGRIDASRMPTELTEDDEKAGQDRPVACVLNTILEMPQETAWWECRVQDDFCILLSDSKTQYARIDVSLDKSQRTLFNSSADGDPGDKTIKAPRADVIKMLIWPDEFTLIPMERAEGNGTVFVYVHDFIERSRLARDGDRVYYVDPEKPFIFRDSGMSVGNLIEDIIHRAPAGIQLAWKSKGGRTFDDLHKKMTRLSTQYTLPEIKTRACIAFSNGIVDMPDRYIAPGRMHEALFISCEALAAANTPPFRPRFKTDQAYDPSLWDRPANSPSFHKLINDQLDAETGFLLRASIGRALCLKRMYLAGNHDAFSYALIVVGNSKTGKSTLMTGLAGSDGDPGLFGPTSCLANVTGATVGEGGVGSLQRFVGEHLELAWSTEMPGVEARKSLYNPSAFGPDNFKLIMSLEPVSTSIKHGKDKQGVLPLPFLFAAQDSLLGVNYLAKKDSQNIIALLRRQMPFFFRNTMDGDQRDATMAEKLRGERASFGLQCLSDYMVMRSRYSQTDQIEYHNTWTSEVLKQLHPYGEYILACQQDDESFDDHLFGRGEHGSACGRLVSRKGKFVGMKSFLREVKYYRQAKKHDNTSCGEVLNINKARDFVHEARAIEMCGFRVNREEFIACYTCFNDKNDAAIVPSIQCIKEHNKTAPGGKEMRVPQGALLDADFDYP